MPSLQSRSNSPRNTPSPDAAQRARSGQITPGACESGQRRVSRTLAYGVLGSVLAWAALPPLGLWPLAWLAPLPWLLLVRGDRLAGRWPYAALYLAGLAFWLPVLHWLRLPHAATSIGWIALSVYLACYLPVFVALARVAVHQVGCPLLLAAPTIWAGLELAQSHLLTGINIATLGHSQYRWIDLIQISDLCGGYGVSFLIVFVAACVVTMLPVAAGRWRWWPALPAIVALAAALAYGHSRLAHDEVRPGLKVALIQGSIDTEMKTDPRHIAQVHDQYFALTRRAIEEHADIDLIVWPETMYRYPLIVAGENPRAKESTIEDEQWTVEDLYAMVGKSQAMLADISGMVRVPMLLGLDTLVFGDQIIDRYNSAVLLDAQGTVRGRYDKMRPVMFGEYIPLGRAWPWLYRLTPLASGLTPGAAPQSLAVGKVRIAPSICFETFLPHFIRQQVADLKERGEEPDLLVNLTNDGWFWGSSELDLHLIAGVFRAVECRKPLLIAANTGFSAVIDGAGRIVRQGPRRATDVVVAEVPLETRTSPYVRWGDWGAGLCLTFAGTMAGIGVYQWRRRARQGKMSMPEPPADSSA